jgi:type II secretory pathway predicted ATPase ExeA
LTRNTIHLNHRTKPGERTIMLDKIQSYFGFTTMPFGRALAPGMLFRSGEHAQAAARIGYGIDTRGITVITGEVGVGKTVAARAAIDRAEPTRHHLIYIPDPTIGARGIYHHIVKQLNAAVSLSCVSTKPTCLTTLPSKPCDC